MITTQVEDMAI